MNKKGQFQPFFLFMIGVILFILVFKLASPIVKSSNLVQNRMDCDNESISTGQKISCTVVDTTAPFIFAILIGLAAMAFTSKLLGG